MKKLIVIAALLILSNASANELFWKDVSEDKLSDWKGKKFILMGELTSKKRVVRARDNYWNLKIKDPNSDKYVDMKIYTIVRFKRINTIDCELGEMMSVSGKLNVEVEGNSIGKILIKKKDDQLVCHKKKEESLKK